VKRLTVMTGLVILGLTGAAAETVAVFGLPLGGKAPAINQCPSNAEKAKSVCWVGRPFKGAHGHLGSVHLPNPDSRPAWAAHAVFEASVDGAGLLQRLKASTVVAANRSEIANSIASRWGLPDQTSLAQPGPASATWTKPELTIFMFCSDKCSVEFRSAAEQAARETAAAARKRTDAARPASP
jgi:hypothetical protein